MPPSTPAPKDESNVEIKEAPSGDKVKVTKSDFGTLIEPQAEGTEFFSPSLEYKVQFGAKLIEFQPYSFASNDAEHGAKRIGSKYITEDAKEIEFLNKIAKVDGHVLTSRPPVKLKA